jgi:DNA invertase Pin-like site-specific DNA recombinase
MTAALYARISTQEGKQFAGNQLRELRDFATRSGWTVYREYVDEISGAKGRKDRAQLDALMMDAAARRFDVVLVFALDRFTREGVLKAFQYIEQLNAWKVEFRSLTEPQFSTSGPHAELFVAIAAWMAKQERQRLQERIAAGVRRARAEGRKLGRPAAVLDVQKARDLMTAGYSMRKAAAALEAKPSTLQRRLKRQ